MVQQYKLSNELLQLTNTKGYGIYPFVEGDGMPSANHLVGRPTTM